MNTKHEKPTELTREASIEHTANLAADWWAKHLENPSMDNGDDALSGFLAILGGTKREYKPEQIQAFKDAIASGIVESFQKNPNAGHYIRLDVDYGPQSGILIEALHAANITTDMMTLPMKTSCAVYFDRIVARAGYNGQQETLTVGEYLTNKSHPDLDTAGMSKAEYLMTGQDLSQKLLNLSPGTSANIVEFARLLSDRVKNNEELLPEGLVMACVLLCYDLEEGIDGFTGVAIESPLVKNSKVIESVSSYLPNLFSAICPPEFAKKATDSLKM